MSSVAASRIKLLVLAAIFFAPMIFAWVVYFGPSDWKPGGSTAVGHLVTPARPLPEIEFTAADGEAFAPNTVWTLMHVGEQACDENCLDRLWQTRQMRTLLHRHRGRLQRAYLGAPGEDVAELWAGLKDEHPRLRVLSLAPAQRAEFEAWLGPLGVDHPVLLIDPLGNFLMFYGDELPLKGMLKDIKRIMKLSNIG